MAATLIHKLTSIYNNEKKHEFILLTLYNVLSKCTDNVYMMMLVVVY